MILLLKNYSWKNYLKKYPLYDYFPRLKEALAQVTLGDFPTPVEHLDRFGVIVGAKNIYIKRDDLSGMLDQRCNKKLFGGSKIRKLEFILGDALTHNAKTVVTLGSAGSNHAVATAVCAQLVGLRSISMLKPQPNAYNVRRNLKLMHHYGSQIRMFSDKTMREKAVTQLFVDNKKISADNQDALYFIPTGGSCPLGSIGYVNAAFELKEQIDHGLMPKPDYMYVAAGSLGTAIGLMLGMRAAQLDITIVLITVEPYDRQELNQNFTQLFNTTNALLNNFDDTFPLFEIDPTTIHIVDSMAGSEYGLFTYEAQQMIHLLYDSHRIILDGTYTGKACAGMMHDIKMRGLQDSIILFWNTFCGQDFSDSTSAIDYKSLPSSVHQYFEDDVQEFDQ